MKTGLPLAMLIVGALLAGTSPLLAQPEKVSSTASPGARAVASGKAGLAAFEQGNWTAALERFREAEQLVHSPVFVLYAARSLRKLERLLEARATLERIAHEPLNASAPSPWLKAKAEATSELSQVNAEVPTASVGVEGDSNAVHLTLDGRSIRAGKPYEVDPGEHRAVATVGTLRRETTFSISPGAQQKVILAMPVPLAEGPRQSAAKPRARPTNAPPYVPGWVLTGTGAAALTAGGVFGILALDKKATLQKHLPEACQPGVCPSSQKAIVDAHFKPARTLALASDVLWISGAILTTTGVTLLLIDPRLKGTASASVAIYPGGGAVSFGF